ncbi:carbohydrate kinase pfkb [Lucifera butyrica]|uniref:Tagatose-6-phosphate kinase n=1 Tax=Lucifera butyrica TaxID=1351585 RepID=A0A498R181_9FIRM|nr:1-phosphofructokinase [Lucifera butyrica]VBB05194.1 carbohydrate kinase pfkb [Lucifera butyrica]
MITTVTLNPAIDKTVEINSFAVNSVNRISSVRLDVGGKGINVSKVLLNLDGRSRAVGILAGKAGEYIRQYLDEAGIENDFIFVPGETRTNLKVVDQTKHTNTDINEIGLEVTAGDMERVKEKVLRDLDAHSVVVFSGSVPRNVNADVYRQWIEAVNKAGARTILDADGELFKQGIEAGPYLIKPNIHELENWLDRKINTMPEIAATARRLMQQYGIAVVVVSLGEKGALFVNQDGAIWAHGICVEVKSTVGAGDSMVAALAYALDAGYSWEKAISLAVAAGTANVMTAGTEPSSLAAVQELEKQVTWEYLLDDTKIEVGM